MEWCIAVSFYNYRLAECDPQDEGRRKTVGTTSKTPKKGKRAINSQNQQNEYYIECNYYASGYTYYWFYVRSF